ncbi:MAG: Flp pilus assembly complex ATPase component TadA [Candidatus Micrarchaeales archaeon]|nr:Flp pilus assembly complex ATPase component TadA [Candidatus Micrarchaeales archaeon]
MDQKLYAIEDLVLKQLVGKFAEHSEDENRKTFIYTAAKNIKPDISESELGEIYADVNDLAPIKDLLESNTIEDITVNNTKNIYVFDSLRGFVKLDASFDSQEKLNRFVGKLKLYATNQQAHGKIMDVHMPSGSRANIITSPVGYDVTIRNFKQKPLSIIDLINNRTLDYKIASRLWLYVDGLRVKPANLMIGGIPASGKTTLLNTLFSFFRPEKRIVTIEETYELNTEAHDNTARLETNTDLPMTELVKNALRMRPDLIIIGEIRGAEANDLAMAMNIGKISMGTIHASTSRDVILRLEHSPMDVPRDIIPVIDAIVVVSSLYRDGKPQRKVVQISEISGIETQVLLSDVFKYDYKTNQAAPMMPSITYRDNLSKMVGVSPSEILAEEAVRARILEQLNIMGKRDMKSISEAVSAYYDNPEALLRSLGLGQLSPAVPV